jgi:hypothetical protein
VATALRRQRALPPLWDRPGAPQEPQSASQTRLRSQGQPQTIAVYRYYCQNPACPYQTFTNLPPDLVPYSPWRMDVQVLALQA